MKRYRPALAFLASVSWLLAVAVLPVVAAAPPPGPPFPSPEVGRAVYDYAGLFSAATIAKAEATIDAIEVRTGAEVVVYTQPSGGYPTTEETEAKARALIDAWGVGRAGFNDGLAIFFDMDPTLEHGQVQLYAAPGFEAAYLSNGERQAIFDNDMLPLLRSGDFDGALDVALEKVDASANAEHAATLERGRQVNAVLGLVGAPIVFMGLVRLGVLQLAPVRQGPGLSRRSVDPHARATTRPDRGVRGDDHGRRDVAPGADVSDARPGFARPARLPRGTWRAFRSHEGGDRRQPSTRRRHHRGPAPAQLATSDRPGRGTRARSAPRRRRQESVSSARTTC